MKVKLEFDLDVPTDNQEYMMLLKAPQVAEDLEKTSKVLKEVERTVSDMSISPSDKVEKIYNVLNIKQKIK